MFFLLVFVVLFEIIFCAEQSLDITFKSNNDHYKIGYLDSNYLGRSVWQPFNKAHTFIWLTQDEISRVRNNAPRENLFEKNDDPSFLFMLISVSTKFSNIAQIFRDTNLDENQKKYVSEIFNVAEGLQLLVRKYAKLELGKGIMPVLSEFITECCTSKIFEKENREDEDVRLSVTYFLKEFNRTCEMYYFNVYEQIKTHPKIDVSLGLLLLVSLYYMYIKNVHFIPQHHKIERLILIGLYGAWLVYDFKDRVYLHMAYQVYKNKYEELVDPNSNNNYLFFKYGD